MKILIATTYFEPYHSGLSVYAHRLAEGLARRGHEVVVITSQHTKTLPLKEQMNGFTVVRIPILLHLSKGVIMPALSRLARPWVKWADILNLHLPQFESFVYARLAREMSKPLVLTYHCDLVMSGGLLNRLAGGVTTTLQRGVLSQADIIVQNSMDYAENSSVLKPLLGKTVAIPTPVNCRMIKPEETSAFLAKYGLLSASPKIGLAGRVASEKGYEYLAAAMPEVLAVFPQACVVHAGGWNSAVGEKAYQDKVESLLKPLGNHWVRLGYLSDQEFQAFFAGLDVLVFSSLNSTESFGIVQIEAMCQGTPVVASDLPGVRQPVKQTGLGKIISIRDPHALTSAIIEVLIKKGNQKKSPIDYLRQFSQDSVASRYEAIMEQLIKA